MLLKEYNKNTSCLFLEEDCCKILNKLNCDSCKFFKSKDDKKEIKLQNEYWKAFFGNLGESEREFEKRRLKNETKRTCNT